MRARVRGPLFPVPPLSCLLFALCVRPSRSLVSLPRSRRLVTRAAACPVVRRAHASTPVSLACAPLGSPRAAHSPVSPHHFSPGFVYRSVPCVLRLGLCKTRCHLLSCSSLACCTITSPSPQPCRTVPALRDNRPHQNFNRWLLSPSLCRGPQRSTESRRATGLSCTRIGRVSER